MTAPTPRKRKHRSQAEAGRLVTALLDAAGTRRNPIRNRLAEMGTLAAPALVATLKHHDAFARWEAVSLLGEIADPKTHNAVLAFALREEDVHARWRSYWAVSRFDVDKTVPSLLRALRTGNSRMRWSAALILSMLGRNEAGPELLRGLKSADDWRQWEALGGIKALALPNTEKAIAPFLHPTAPRALRQEAVLALGAIGSEAALSKVIGALSDSEPEVRWRASLALSRSANPRALRALQRRLRREKHSGVREQLRKDIRTWRD